MVGAISAELGVGEVLPAPPKDEVVLQRDYEMFQVGTPVGTAPGLRLQASAIDDLGFDWHAKEGLLASMAKVVHEYRVSRKVLPLCVLMHGNDDLAKSELSAALAADYKLPYIVASAAVDEAAAKEDELGAELKAALAAGGASDELVAKALAPVLMSTTCRNQGYILQGFPETHAQAAVLFGDKPEAEAEGAE